MFRVRVVQFVSVIILLITILHIIYCNDPADVPDVYTLSANDIDGNEVNFEQFRGKITLIVNIANGCGYADSHYRGMGRMLDVIGPDNFTILTFPCNQFGGQEPGTADDIKNHIMSNYGHDYIILEKTDVIGADAHPVYKNLAAQFDQAPDWNFWKYLVDEAGRVLNAWGPQDTIEDIFLEVRAAVLRLQNIPSGTGSNAFPARDIKQEL